MSTLLSLLLLLLPLLLLGSVELKKKEASAVTWFTVASRPNTFEAANAFQTRHLRAFAASLSSWLALSVGRYSPEEVAVLVLLESGGAGGTVVAVVGDDESRP